MGRKSLPIIADLTVEDQVNRAVSEAVDFFGRIDILVNNVGGVSPEMSRMIAENALSLRDVQAPPQTLFYSPDIWDRYYRLNLKSHVMLSNAATPYFIRQRSGKIVNISSDAGRLAEPGHIAYAAMKAGDISLTWSLAKALAPYNINVNCVCPGLVYTPLWARGTAMHMEGARANVRKIQSRGEKLPPPLETFAEADAKGITPKDFWLNVMVAPSTPLGREQTPEDIGHAVAFLVSEDARNITGQALNVDGGLVMR
jgi:NAD(P)-dependent dehydrogenase (short-subunit alcohol dehydrogenase family)